MKTRSVSAAWKGQSKCDTCNMRHLALFSDLEPDDLLKNPLPIDDMQFEEGSTLYEGGHDGKSIFTIRSGAVKLVQYLPNGDYRIVRILRQGHVAGLETLLGDPYQHTAIALAPTLTCRIPCEIVNTLDATTPRMHRQLMRRFQQSVQQADEWLTMLSTGSARARVARLLLYLQVDPGQPCELFNREDVAAMLGMTPETASRVVAEMKRGGVITQVHSNLFHCNVEELTNIALN